VRRLKGTNYWGAALVFLAVMGLLFGRRLGVSGLWFLLLFAAGVTLMVLHDAGRDAARSPLTFLALFGLYMALAFWDFALILILLPAIILTMILGPFMIGAAVLSGLMLGVYFIENILHFDIAGVSGLETAPQAGVAALIFAVSILALWWHFSRADGEDRFIDRAGAWGEAMRGRLRDAADEVRADQ
jgi:hypothetical protein